ncbi:MAG: YIP1 family protein [Nanoarchaeota archaeon]|nr:YIP1 family protein [Nanoarchaeota archaeon]
MDFKISFVDSIKQAIEIVKLNGKVAENVSKDQNATLMGILIIAIGGFLSQITGLNILVIVSSLVILIIGYFIVVGILHIVARLFGGQAKYIEYFRAVSYASILSWLGILAIIPFLGIIISFLISIWGIVVGVVILENVHKLTRGKAIIVVLLPFILLTLLVALGALSYFGVSNPGVLLP